MQNNISIVMAKEKIRKNKLIPEQVIVFFNDLYALLY